MQQPVICPMANIVLETGASEKMKIDRGRCVHREWGVKKR